MHLNKAYLYKVKKINDNLNKIKILEEFKIDLLNTGRVGGISLLMHREKITLKKTRK